MQSTEFDATLGGTEHLPNSANSLKFAASRSVEIAAMTESIQSTSQTKLVFQSLPVHMRRRVMSHNCKRLPRNLQHAHLEQMKKSGLPPKQKRPSRKYRRRPAILLQEYNRRQKEKAWLETHIWHAKRFHMTERWGYRLAYAPCDKAFRACYRASSSHCLLQDVSYLVPIQISGPESTVKSLFQSITNPACGLGICAKAFTTGNREGAIHIYKKNMFPLGYIGKVQFLWVPASSTNPHLWMFVHPSYAKQIESILTDLLCNDEKCESYEKVKRRKVTNTLFGNIKMKVLTGTFNRFRLTGPNSHAVVANSLRCVDNIDQIKSYEWIKAMSLNPTSLYLKEKNEYWQSISSAFSPSQLPSKVIVGLVVRDPRLNRPSHRTKAQNKNAPPIKSELMHSIPPYMSISPLWDQSLHEAIKKNIMTNGEFIEHVKSLSLVPGEVYEEDPALQCAPVVVIQRPGSQEPNFKKIGYGSGWDVIVPSGYGLPFWLTFVMFGARSGGLRETESLAFEMGECYLPPDSEAGRAEELRLEVEMREKYFRLPPSKRVNYPKLTINSPFICPWKLLLKDWSNKAVDDFFVLRDKKILENVQDCIHSKKALPQIHNIDICLVSVYLRLTVKGKLTKHALICLPSNDDIANPKSIYEPHREDPNEKLRKTLKINHMKTLKKLRRIRIKLKKKMNMYNKKNQKRSLEPSEYVKSMRKLWLPTNIETVYQFGSREVLGYVQQGGFSFSEACSCGVGYVAYNALNKLLTAGLNQVLVRNTSSRKYSLAKIEIIKNI